jgi:hypothetical protein
MCEGIREGFSFSSQWVILLIQSLASDGIRAPFFQFNVKTYTKNSTLQISRSGHLFTYFHADVKRVKFLSFWLKILTVNIIGVMEQRTQGFSSSCHQQNQLFSWLKRKRNPSSCTVNFKRRVFLCCGPTINTQYLAVVWYNPKVFVQTSQYL